MWLKTKELALNIVEMYPGSTIVAAGVIAFVAFLFGVYVG